MRQPRYYIPEPEAVTTFPDGRERCNKNAAGKREYLARTVEMWSVNVDSAASVAYGVN